MAYRGLLSSDGGLRGTPESREVFSAVVLVRQSTPAGRARAGDHLVPGVLDQGCQEKQGRESY